MEALATPPAGAAVRSSPLLICSHVARQFGRRRVLRDISFEGHAGEVLGLLGPNGSGKTTLLAVLSTMAEPSRGRVAYPCRRGTGFATPRARRTRPRTAVVRGTDRAREPRLFARLAGVRDIANAVATALEQARLTDCGDDLVERFSRGMRQRLAFERVVLPAPRVLLLDEPFTGLDDESARRMVERLAALRDAGTLVVLATHDLILVESLVDRACVVKNGVLVALDPSVPLPDAYRAVVGTDAAPQRRHGSLVLGNGIDSGHQRPIEAPSASEAEPSIADIARATWVLLAKDLRIEWRSREGLLTTACFALSCVLVFSFGLVRDGTPAADAGPAVLWVTVALAGTLAMARTFERERAAGTLMAVLASPAPRPSIYLGKWGALMALIFAVEIVLLPLVALFFQMPLDRRPLMVVGLLAAARRVTPPSAPCLPQCSRVRGRATCSCRYCCTR